MKPFYWTAGGIFALIVAIFLIDVAKVRYQEDLFWFAHATSESSWVKYCGKTKALLIANSSVWYSEQPQPPEVCEQGNAFVTQPVKYISAECPITAGYEATGCDPNGIRMQTSWRISQQQKSGPR